MLQLTGPRQRLRITAIQSGTIDFVGWVEMGTMTHFSLMRPPPPLTYTSTDFTHPPTPPLESDPASNLDLHSCRTRTCSGLYITKSNDGGGLAPSPPKVQPPQPFTQFLHHLLDHSGKRSPMVCH